MWSAGWLWRAVASLVGARGATATEAAPRRALIRRLSARRPAPAGDSRGEAEQAPAEAEHWIGQSLLGSDDLLPLILRHLDVSELGAAACVSRRLGGWPGGAARCELRRRGSAVGAPPLALLADAERVRGRAAAAVHALLAPGDDAKKMALVLELIEFLARLRCAGAAALGGVAHRVAGDKAACGELARLLKSPAEAPRKLVACGDGTAGVVIVAGPRGAALLLIWVLVRGAPAGASGEALLAALAARGVFEGLLPLRGGDEFLAEEALAWRVVAKLVSCDAGRKAQFVAAARGDVLPRRAFSLFASVEAALAAANALVRLTALPNDDAPSAAVFAALSRRGGARWLVGELASCLEWNAATADALARLVANLAVGSPARAAAFFDAGALHALAKHVLVTCVLHSDRAVAAECALRTLAHELRGNSAPRPDAALAERLVAMLQLRAVRAGPKAATAVDAAARCAADVVAALLRGADAEAHAAFAIVAACLVRLAVALRPNPVARLFEAPTRLEAAVRGALEALRHENAGVADYLDAESELVEFAARYARRCAPLLRQGPPAAMPAPGP
ncbi:hypothetical protein M885DRAFT_507031 [Pelagophyceae sp. CCMP2097]|nr:hypothetical protein M885DRAFT_507031 [Pelagophyceae sp. CCMP2097]